MHHVALEVCNVVIGRAIVLKRIRMTTSIVEEIQRVIAIGFPHELTAGIEVVVCHTVDNLARSQTIGIVCVGNVRGAIGSGSQTSAIPPSERPTSAVVVAQGVATGIVGNGFAVIRRQQIFKINLRVNSGMPIYPPLTRWFFGEGNL